MALQVVLMKELKLEPLLEPERTGDTVTEVCRRAGSRVRRSTATGGATGPRGWPGWKPARAGRTARRGRSRPNSRRGSADSLAGQEEPDYAPHAIVRKVWSTGLAAYDGVAIVLGRRWAGARVRIVPVGELVHVYYGSELIRVLAPDRSRRYQRLGTGGGKAVVAGKR